MRRDGDLGIGDTRGLTEWIDLCADHEVGFVQLLPIHEMGLDDSPYNAISSVALEPLFLTMEEVPGIDLAELDRARQGVGAGEVDYATVRSAKGGLLESAWTRWPQQAGGLRPEFARFCREEEGWLADYTVFRVLMEECQTAAWEQWPEPLKEVHEARSAATARPERLDYFAWLQWLIFRQWRQVRAHADRRGVRLMGDIPIGVSRSSADVFFHRDDFDLGWCGGAPPERMFEHDEFIRKWGQNWGIPLYHWDRMRAGNFPWWRRRIGKLTDVFHLFRIDHVLGFYRIYAFPWTPDRNGEFLALNGAEAAEKTGGLLPRWVPRPDDYETNRQANLADGDRRLRMVQEAAGGAEVVAEDLGCVPGYVRPHLTTLGIPGFRIPHWDLDEEKNVIPGDQLPECSFATYATHDHDSIPAMWEGFRRRAAENPAGGCAGRVETAWQALADFAGIQPEGAFGDDVLWPLVEALMACRSRYAAIMITDLYRLSARINQPGTLGGRNWSFRVADTAARSAKRPQWAKWREAIQKSNRGLSK
ncbi:4-alpha-glucanotransferase [Haloferula sargassicola]|uniref:4-alpha-glucanotransferase n=1 Tax=Haloferula sargassicola TaxID=490096 RepID=A0ABP9UR45_9BACT